MFCEKPLSLDLDDCLRVEAEAAKHPKLKVMIGYVRRFDPSYQDAYDKSIDAGAIGGPFLVQLADAATRTIRRASSCSSRRRAAASSST